MPSSATSNELPTFSLGKAKASLTPHRWDRIAQSIADTLQRILALSKSKPDFLKRPSKLIAFVDSYTHDAAKYDHTYYPESLTEVEIHSSTLKLVQMICDASPKHKPPFDANALFAIALAYQDEPYLEDLKSLLQSQSNTLEEDLRYATIPTLIWILREPFVDGQTETIAFLSTRNRTFQMINALVRSRAKPVLSSLSSRKDLLLAMQYCYDVVLKELGDQEVSQPVMETKLGIIDAFHTLVDYLVQHANDDEKVREQLFDTFFGLVEASSLPPPPHSWFINVPLLMDYDHTYHICETLKSKIGPSDGMVEVIVTGIQGKMENCSAQGDDAGGMAILLSQISVQDKGKGKGKAKEVMIHPMIN